MAEELPVAECKLDLAGLREQQARYARVARDVSALERDPLTITASLSADADDDLVTELVAVERECCPFFSIDWRPAERRLTFGVAGEAHAPALDAIEYALGR